MMDVAVSRGRSYSFLLFPRRTKLQPPDKRPRRRGADKKNKQANKQASKSKQANKQTLTMKASQLVQRKSAIRQNLTEIVTAKKKKTENKTGLIEIEGETEDKECH